jgi:hypothetical protein
MKTKTNAWGLAALAAVTALAVGCVGPARPMATLATPNEVKGCKDLGQVWAQNQDGPRICGLLCQLTVAKSEKTVMRETAHVKGATHVVVEDREALQRRYGRMYACDAAL